GAPVPGRAPGAGRGGGGPVRPARALLLLALAGCGRPVTDMRDQRRAEPYEASAVFADGAAARPLVPGVEPRPGARDAAGGLERVQERSVPCHGLDGSARGMVALRGHPRPPSFHDDRLREAPDEHLLRVVERGLGTMPPYRHVPADQRRAIVRWVRALQLSQHAPLALVPEDARARPAEER